MTYNKHYFETTSQTKTLLVCSNHSGNADRRLLFSGRDVWVKLRATGVAKELLRQKLDGLLHFITFQVFFYLDMLGR